MARLLTLRPLATLTVGLLAATIALDVVVIAFDAAEIVLLYDLMNGVEVPLASIEASDSRQAAAATAGLALFVATALAFVAWFHAANSRAEQTGRLRHSATWSVVSWFVPFLNLVRPKQIADDLWAASDPVGAGDADTSARSRLVMQWWTLWLVATLGEIAVSRASHLASTADGLQSVAVLHASVLVVHVAAAVWAIRFVHALTRRLGGPALSDAEGDALPDAAVVTPAG